MRRKGGEERRGEGRREEERRGEKRREEERRGEERRRRKGGGKGMRKYLGQLNSMGEIEHLVTYDSRRKLMVL